MKILTESNKKKPTIQALKKFYWNVKQKSSPLRVSFTQRIEILSVARA